MPIAAQQMLNDLLGPKRKRRASPDRFVTIDKERFPITLQNSLYRVTIRDEVYESSKVKWLLSDLKCIHPTAKLLYLSKR